jgi:hypothetical protein
MSFLRNKDNGLKEVGRVEEVLVGGGMVLC